MWDFIDSGYAWDFLIALAVHGLAGLIVWAVMKARGRPYFRKPLLDWIVPSFTVSVIGLSAGVLAGSSRIYATDLVVPAVLTAFFGFGLWLYSRAEAPGRLRVLAFTAVFSFCVLIGTFSGWALDDGWDEGDDAVDQNVRLELPQPRA